MKKKQKGVLKSLRKAVVDAAQRMSQTGLSPGRSGNISCRVEGGMFITPSGLAYSTLKPSDIVYVCDDGTVQDGSQFPSTEWQFHLALYHVRHDIHAIVHSHSLHATVLACAEKNIPAFHYMVAGAGGSEIPLVPYAAFGTEELAQKVVHGLGQLNACLLSHHGQIAVGDSLEAAFELAEDVEVLSEQYTKVLGLGSPRLLSEADMKIVLQKFKSYGRKASHKMTKVKG